MKIFTFIGIVLFVFLSCKDDNTKNEDSKYLNLVELKIGESLKLNDNSILKFDSVLSDSRCPTGAVCVWAGEAKIKLVLKRGNLEHILSLNISEDTTIENVNISLKELNPYPSIENISKPKESFAKLQIIYLDELKSNAKLLNFNAEKCGCCWGWLLQMGNDTIKTDDGIVGEKIGYCIKEPIDVYVELGELEKSCTEMVGMKYYKIKQIIKTK